METLKEKTDNGGEVKHTALPEELRKLKTYSRKNHGINAYLKPRVYYYASEDVEKLVVDIKSSNDKLNDRVKELEKENEALREALEDAIFHKLDTAHAIVGDRKSAQKLKEMAKKEIECLLSKGGSNLI